MNPIKPRAPRSLAAVLLACICICAAGLTSGCVGVDKTETIEGENQAAKKTIDNARAEQADTTQRTKEAEDLTKTGK